MNQQSATTFGSSSALWRGIRNHTLWDISRKYTRARSHTHKSAHTPKLTPICKSFKVHTHPNIYSLRFPSQSCARKILHSPRVAHQRKNQGAHTRTPALVPDRNKRPAHSYTCPSVFARGHAHIHLLTQSPIHTSPIAIQAALRVWEPKRT